MAALIVQQQSIHDLWADAAAQLSDNDRKNINFSRDDKLNILAELLSSAEKCKQKFLDSRWKYTRKSGETVIISDLFGKIVRWIDSFRQIGDIVMQYDPAHAALPWAGVRFVLQIVVNTTNQAESVIEGLADVAELIFRSALTEALFLHRASRTTVTTGLERAITKLYASILRWLSEARQHLERSTSKRMIRSAVLADTPLESCLKSIRMADEDVHKHMDYVDWSDGADRHAELTQTLQSITVPLKRIDGSLKNMQDNLEMSRRNKIIKWLSPEPHMGHHNQAKRGVLESTGQWLLSDAVFMKWKDESASSILWLHGSLGTGKSKLVSIVIEDALKSFEAGHSSKPVFFYCSRNPAEPTRSDPKAILASLARQLSLLEPEKRLLKPTVDLFKRDEAEGFSSGQLQIEECCSLIMQLIELHPHMTIVIDAMDECDPTKRPDLIQALEHILKESSRLVKIFVTSRDDGDIVMKLSNYPNLTISSQRNGADIARFVAVEVERLIQARRLLAYSNSQATMKETIIWEVSRRANGMFLWANMQLQHLCSFIQDADLENALGELPPDLYTVYANHYDEISARPGKDHATVLRHVLCWLLCARETLQTDDFLAMVRITSSRESNTASLSKDLVLEICKNLVIFDSELNTFRFAHLSVREFLEQRSEYSEAASNKMIAENCLWAMLSTCQNLATKKLCSQLGWHSKTMPTGLEKLCKYADICWAVHCRLSGDARMSGVLKMALEAIFSDHEDNSTSSLDLWCERVQTHLKRYIGGGHIVHQLRDAIPGKESTSYLRLFVACAFDFDEHIESILSTTVQTTPFVNGQGESPVFVIARHGSCATLSRLIGQDKFRIELTEEVAEEAAWNQKKGKEVMKLLLKHGGANVTITKEATLFILKSFDKDTVALLLDQRGADFVITEEEMKAAGRNYTHGEGVIALILDLLGQKKANIRLTGEIAKSFAGDKVCGKDFMMLLLHRLGEVVTITEEVVATIIRRFDDDVVTILLKRCGADITEEALKAAAENYKRGSDLVTLLLDRCGTDVTITEEVAKAAARNRYDGKRVMELLLDRRGADVPITEGVMKAAAGNYSNGLKVIQLLHERKVDFPITEEVVKMAAGNGDRRIVEFLCDIRDIEITEGLQTLYYLDHQAGVRIVTEQWRCVANLCAAAKKGDAEEVYNKDIRRHDSVVRVLLETKAVDVDAEDVAKQTPLFWAAAHDHGARQDYTDINGRSPLAIANFYGRVYAAHILAEAKRQMPAAQVQCIQ
ncbi:hypothetical protein IQ07DRAFT_608823 [Pyrenochaeta sp. DS3sAY3a]|nr:hypothetical protein IQ07DRAFT_608823 [Pyrenochaeta sp. DS3sAY3a]